MNFHDRLGLDKEAPRATVAYRPAPRHVAKRHSALEHMAARAGAPIFGSRFVFPRRLNEAVALLQAGQEAGDLPPEHAAGYYGADLHLDLDPATLTHRISDEVTTPDGARWMGRSFLDAADWSGVISRIDESPIHLEMCELVAGPSDYRRTQTYRNLMLGIEVGKPAYRHGVLMSSTERIDAYIIYCRDLIKSARKRGIVRHTVLGRFHRLRLKHRRLRSIAVDAGERDVGVAITADGTIIRLLGGKHRMAIAQALKLPRIPVEVRLVHAAWIAELMNRTGLPAHLALKEGVAELRAAAARL